MVELNKEITQATENESNESEAAAEEPQTVVMKTSRAGLWFGLLQILLILVAAGVGWYFFRQLDTRLDEVKQDLARNQDNFKQQLSQITGIQADLSTLNARFTGVNTEFANIKSLFEREISNQSDRHNEKLAQFKAQYDEAIKRLQRQLGQTRGDWLIADAEYLLSVAQQRLYMLGDIATAIQALEAADQRLHDSGDPGVFKARQALAQELSMLKGLKPIDVVGLIAKLHVIQEKAKDLKVFPLHSGSTVAHKDTTLTTQLTNDSPEVMKPVWKDVLDLFVVRRSDKPFKAMLVPDEMELIHEQLRVKLELIKLAIVQRNAELYNTSLVETQGWLTQFFDMDTSPAQEVLTGIQDLQQQSLQLDIPEIGQSLKLLRDLAKFRIESDKALYQQQGTSS